MLRPSSSWLRLIIYAMFMYFDRVRADITPFVVATTTKNCAEYSLTNTNNGTDSYCICSFDACPGDLITVSACACSGNAVLSLVNQTTSNLDRLYPRANQQSTCQNSCPGFSFYMKDSECRTYAIREGCLDYGSCSALLTVTTTPNSNSTARRRLADTISARSGSESDTCSGVSATYIVVSIVVLLLIPCCIVASCVLCFISCCCPDRLCCTRSLTSVVPMAAAEHVQGTPTFIVHTLPQQMQQRQQGKAHYGGVEQATAVVAYERLDMELGNMAHQSVPTAEARQLY